MLKLNRMTDYAVVVLGALIREDGALTADQDAVQTTTQLAEATGVQGPTVAKLMKQLAQSGLVESQRGVGGGYRLARIPEEITVADIVTAMEGPIALTACVDGAELACNVEQSCPMAGNWNKVNLAIRGALEQITLADMAQPLPSAASSPALNSLMAWRTGVPAQEKVSS